MSTDDIEIEEALPIDRADGAAELDQRDTFRVLFTDPAVRNFVFAAFGAIGMIFLILFQQGSDLAGLFIVIFGICGILFRWTAAPVLILFVITYFMWTPTGIPGDHQEKSWEIEEGHFRIADVMLVLSLLVYVTCHYRIFGLVYQAVAFEGPVRRKDETPTRRPPALIHPMELGILFAVCTGLAVLGQLIWWFANAVEAAPTDDFPLRWAQPGRTVMHVDESSVPGGMNPGATRFVVLVGMLFFGTLLARLVYGYWRLRAMGAAEGGMILLDGGWSETSRERQRQEKWRIWGRKRIEAAEAPTETTQARSQS